MAAVTFFFSFLFCCSQQLGCSQEHIQYIRNSFILYFQSTFRTWSLVTTSKLPPMFSCLDGYRSFPMGLPRLHPYPPCIYLQHGTKQDYSKTWMPNVTPPQLFYSCASWAWRAALSSISITGDEVPILRTKKDILELKMMVEEEESWRVPWENWRSRWISIYYRFHLMQFCHYSLTSRYRELNSSIAKVPSQVKILARTFLLPEQLRLFYLN